MFDQTFALNDIPRIFLLAFLELLLSADNAVILALLTHRLPEKERRKALFIGVASAFILRAGALLSVAFLLKYRWIQLAGAAYLIYIAFHHFWKKEAHQPTPVTRSFWGVVALIELFDLAFAVDSIIAGIAFVNSDTSKLWIVYIGGLIGLLCTRVAADVFNRLLHVLPKLETSAYLLVAWVGIKLGAYAFGHPIPYPLFWAVTALLFLFALIRRK